MSSPTSMATIDGDRPDPIGDRSHGVEERNYISYCPKDPTFRVRPPTTDNDDDPPTDSIVLDTKAYLDERTNSSTADAYVSGPPGRRHLIKVTFWFAHPPRISYFTVHFPDLSEPAESALAELPRVLCTDGDLVLFRVALCPRHLVSLPRYNDYIIFRSGTNKLQVLPPHPTRLFPDLQIGLLRCHSINDRFFVAALSSAFRRGHFKLDLFDSETGKWINKPMCVESSHKQSYSYSSPTKVIAIGGKSGSIAWVDLRQGILICDLLRGDDTLRYIRLPFLMARNKMQRGGSCERDIAFSNRAIKYFEMCAHPRPGSLDGTTYISEDWEAAAWKWMDSEKNWHMEYKFKASEVLVDKSYYELLPELVNHDEDMKTMPILSSLHTGHPALSLHDDGVVYIMAKFDHRDQKACILAVNMRNKTVKAVAPFNAERTSRFSSAYLQSNISKYVARRSSNRGKLTTGEASRRN